MSSNPKSLDWQGNAHTYDGGDLRIVSLVPSLTELVCSLGLRAQLVGRTRFCVHPSGLADDSANIGGTKDVDIERVAELRPTHVVVNVDENLRETADALRSRGIRLIVTHPVEPADNVRLFRLFGAAFGVEGRASELERTFVAELSALEATKPRPVRRVLYLIWKNPWMTIGPDTYVHRTLALAGLECVAPPVTSAIRPCPNHRGPISLRRRSCSAPSHTPSAHGTSNHSKQPIHSCPGQIHLIDGEMTSWYGPRAIEGLRYLRRFRERVSLTPYSR